MKHFCMGKSYRNGKVRLLCTRGWVEDQKQKRNGYTSPLSAIVSTTMLNVECRVCLKLLIPKVEKQIEKLNTQLNKAREVSP